MTLKKWQLKTLESYLSMTLMQNIGKIMKNVWSYSL